ncbi:MAG: hypothetical protein ACTSWX_00885 [Promethearchaeota archaeon]
MYTIIHVSEKVKIEDVDISKTLPKAANSCPEAGSFMPIYKSMVIHPSLNEVIG